MRERERESTGPTTHPETRGEPTTRSPRRSARRSTRRSPRRRRTSRGHETGTFDFPNTWGGWRKGAGRKPKGARAGVPHKTRAPLAARNPAHVTVRLFSGLPSLRQRVEYLVLQRAFERGKERFGFRLVQYSVQSNHVHMLVEARDRRALSRGMQGLLIRCAKALNKLWDRKGSVFADRYHDRILRTPREVRVALAYVLQNAKKHGGALVAGIDPFSSAAWFDGWRERLNETLATPLGALVGAPVTRARTWLLEFGWRRHGLVSVRDGPR